MPNFSASIEPSTESQLLLAARRRRKSLMLKNDTDRHLLIGLDQPATAEDFSTKIAADAEWYAPAGFEGAVSVATDLSRDLSGVKQGRSGLVKALEIF